MKKLLTVLIALSLVASGFAAEPLADLNTVDFSGEASVTWGIDVDTQQTGFKNETDVELIINLLPADMTKSTEGSGVWGELVLLVDGDTNLKAEDPDTPLVHDFANVIVDVAKIHIGDLYVGITSGDFDYNGDILFPNALNYDNGDSDAGYGMVDNSNESTGFDQGLVLGYANDMFNFEAGVRSNNAGNLDVEHITGVTIVTATADDFDDASNDVRYFRVDNEQELVGGLNPDDGEKYYRVVYDTDRNTFWTNQYAIGGYAEFTGVENLKVGLGGSYILSGEDYATKYGKGDHQIFAGADYVFMLNDGMSLVPAVAYNYKMDMNPLTENGTIATNDLGIGLGFRWGDSEDAQSLLDDFYGDDALVYMADGGDEDDTNLLPGVSVWTNLSFLADKAETDLDFDGKADFEKATATDTYLPIMVNAYSGEIVPGLKAYGLFYMNIAPKASTAAALKYNVDGEPVQVGLAASYDIGLGDLTITPKAGVLFNYGKASTEGVEYTTLKEDQRRDTTVTDTTLMPEVAVDVAGLISNTTFSIAWADASYNTMTTVADVMDAGKIVEETTTAKSSTNGEFTIKAKIAL